MNKSIKNCRPTRYTYGEMAMFLYNVDAPVCGETSPQVVGAAIDESLRVRCAVHADPADVTFLWQFNNSGESFNVSPARYGKK